MKKWITGFLATASLLAAVVSSADQIVPISKNTNLVGANEGEMIFEVNGEVRKFPFISTGSKVEAQPAVNYDQVTLAGCVTTKQTIYSSSNLPYQSSVVAFGPYNVSCAGYQTFNVTKLNSGAYTSVTLQKYNGSTWQNVASGTTNISVSVAAGTYRFVISNTCCGSPLQWKLDVDRTL